MVEIAKIVLEFLIVFLILYLGMYLFSFRKIKKYNRSKMNSDVKYLVFKYKIDVVKIGYKKIVKTLMLANSFIVSFLFSITRFIDNIYIRLLVAFILVFPLFAGIYHIIGMHYKKESE